ncbi:MAG: xanthine dehydrogenase family protein subunit M [Candidatus Bipolaricaulia bacterium]
MESFEHVDAPDPQTAVELLDSPNVRPIAGGTDLLTEMKSRLVAPERLVNLKTLRELKGVDETSDHIRIGALTTLTELETHPLVTSRLPILSEAASQAATLQLRNAGTVGGNLCQQVRCGYYRHPDVNCWLKGGDRCYARNGDNTHHAIFGGSGCIAVHPSDLAPALAALDAEVRILGPDGERTEALESIYQFPEEGRRQHTTLAEDELIAEVRVPRPESTSSGTYLKAMERATWSFALVSVAVQLRWDGDRVANASAVLGAVAGTPWRVAAAEELLRGQTLDEAFAERVGEIAVANASPFSHNGYKVPLARNLMTRALRELAAPRSGS